MSTQPSEDDRSENKNSGSSSARRSGLLGWLRAFELREQWWKLLDYLETRRTVRWTLYGGFVLILLVVVFFLWVNPWWTRRNAVSMARQWIAAGQMNYAAEVVQKALEKDAQQPELWLVAAELARLGGQKSMEVEYAHRAAEAQPGNAKYALEWAGAALRADQAEVAEQALATVSVAEREGSSIGQRLLGELARRKRNVGVAINHFEAALRINGAGAINEVPLGLCLITRRDAAQRQRGLELLAKWSGDQEWGADALRILLEDAVIRIDLPGMAKWATALRAHPRCTVGDVPNCLSALVRSDEVAYGGAIAQLKQAHLATPDAAAQLIGWLNQIGRSAEALEWMKTLPEANLQRPPLSVSKAEALRIVGDWSGLQAWTAQGDWGASLEFLRWAYGLYAARSLGDEVKADELWRLVYDHAQTNSVHGLFAATTVFSWGLVKEAEALWWRTAEQNNNLAIDALGALARHYQVQRDAAGQYRVFNRLHAVHPKDADVTNNFVFFAALTGNREQLTEQLARDNLAADPSNPTYRATQAFVLLMRGQADQALKLIKPLVVDAGKSPGVAFVYGLALAGTGDKTKAKAVLETMSPASLTVRENELIKAALGD